MQNIPTIQGVFTAMMTPFNETGGIDRRMTEKFVDFYVEKGLDGIFAVSNVGEFATMSLEEKRELMDICCEAGKGRIQVCPGVTDLNLDNCLALAEHAKQSGADAVVISPPIYYRYFPEYVEEFLRIFFRDTPIPAIFYHSPNFACPVSFDFLLELLTSPHIAAVKESSGSATFLLKLLSRMEQDGLKTPVMLGFEELYLTGLVHGAKGSMTSCGGVVPELMRGINDSFHAGNMERAQKLQKLVCRIIDRFAAYGLPYGYKLGMAARGFPFRILRSTRMEVLEGKLQAEVASIRELVDESLAQL